MQTIIYTDGATSGNPGPSGWGAIVMRGREVKEIGGREKLSTNNRMELTAVINALKETEKAETILVYIDSQYVVNGITKWVFGWQKNNWKTQAGEDVLNKDLWIELFDLVEDRNIIWKVIRGHAGIPGNQRVDDIAVEFSIGNKPKLFYGLVKDYDVNLIFSDQEIAVQKSEKDRKKTKAYSYLSMVDGVIKRHLTWADCENRVRGESGAKFRKSISKEDEESIVKEWKSAKE